MNLFSFGELGLGVFMALAVLPVSSPAINSTNKGYTQLNIVSDQAGQAIYTDDRLLNPWGLVVNRNTLWVSDTHSGMVTTYRSLGRSLRTAIHVPAPGGGPGEPTGIVFNNTRSFVVTNGVRSAPGTYLMDTEDGTLVAWNASVTGTNGVIVADRSGTGAIYKGLALATAGNGLPYLYAANFHSGFVDIFDGQFNYVSSFTDTNLPANYAPFNIYRLRGVLFVSFAKQALPDAEDDEPGPGNGYVDIFDTDGTLLRRFASRGPLNAPWGMAVAPMRFGAFSRALLIGNFGDGRINAYDLLTGKWLGAIQDRNGVDLQIEGLWGLSFEKEEIPGREYFFNARRLYFTAGPGDEEHGLLGIILPISPRAGSAPMGGGY